MYVRGQMVETNVSLALRLFQAAAEQGHAGAQNALGYGQSISDKPDLVVAYKWLKLAVNGHQRDAAANLARLLPRLKTSEISEAEKQVGEFRPKPSSLPGFLWSPLGAKLLW
jgi:TPR repeat protein